MSVSEQAATTGKKDAEVIKTGSLVFLFSELFIFGVLLIVFASYRFANVLPFRLASLELSTLLGALNTVLLLTGALTVTLSLSAAKNGRKPLALFFQSVTILFAVGFIINKMFEYSYYNGKGIFPGAELLANKSHGENMFFTLYYIITGLYTLHVLAGIILTAYVIKLIKSDMNKPGNISKIEFSVTFWNTICAVGVLIFPLLYLIN